MTQIGAFFWVYSVSPVVKLGSDREEEILLRVLLVLCSLDMFDYHSARTRSIAGSSLIGRRRRLPTNLQPSPTQDEVSGPKNTKKLRVPLNQGTAFQANHM